MFFKRGSGEGEYKKKKRGGSPVQTLFSLLISAVILGILGIGLLQAYRSFSGFDPLKLDPKSLAKELATSDSAYELIVGLLSFSPETSLEATKQVLKGETPSGGRSQDNPKSDSPVLFKFAVIGDSHNDTDNLLKALNQSKGAGAKFVVGLGDLSDVGTIEQLRNTKLQFDTFGLPYYTTPGDHDLWESREKKLNAAQNFSDVFGSPYQAFSYANTRIILFYDSDNYLGLDGLQLSWIEEEVKKARSDDKNKLIFAMGSTPLYHPSSDHVMGKVTPKLKDQAVHLMTIFEKNGVDHAFFSDTHFFSSYASSNGLKMTTVGAVTSDRNPQTPRFALVDVYEDGSYNIEEIEVK